MRVIFVNSMKMFRRFMEDLFSDSEFDLVALPDELESVADVRAALTKHASESRIGIVFDYYRRSPLMKNTAAATPLDLLKQLLIGLPPVAVIVPFQAVTLQLAYQASYDEAVGHLRSDLDAKGFSRVIALATDRLTSTSESAQTHDVGRVLCDHMLDPEPVNRLLKDLLARLKPSVHSGAAGSRSAEEVVQRDFFANMKEDLQRS